MRDRLRSTPQLRVFSQNVNRNWGYMDSLLADFVDDYDLLLIQEPPWRLIRHAPSAYNREGEEVIGAPMSPNWGTLVRPSGIDSPPRVAIYFVNSIANLRPGLRRDLINDRDILLFSLGIGEDVMLLTNVYSDSQHSAIMLLFENVMMIPRLHFMCGDFNVRHASWDPQGPEHSIHADHLVETAMALGLTRALPVAEGPTHFPPQQGLHPMVINLMFVPTDLRFVLYCEIVPEARGTSDCAPLTLVLPGPGSLVPVTKWSIKKGSEEEASYRDAVSSALTLWLNWHGNTSAEIDEVISAISTILNKAWENHAKESRLGKSSKGWWTDECSGALDAYRASRDEGDWKLYRKVMRHAKRDFFDDRIQEVATMNRRP
uniref:Pol-like protein Pol-1 n=1 Tax=Tricholoma matsutake TaxID=40145 RepID=Q9C4A3_TRIMT|nr:Pol-like protein Pol-1 [Tricholoma matsutake]